MSILKKFQEAKGNYKVTFTYPANEGVEVVQVLGDFNNWDSNKAPKLKKSKEGFAVSVELNAGNSYEFRYLINGSKWENEQNADFLVPSLYAGTQNCQITLDVVAPQAKKATPAKNVKVAAETQTPASAKVSSTKNTKVGTSATEKTVKVVAAAKPAAKKSATKSTK